MEINGLVKGIIEGLRVADAKTVAEVLLTKKDFSNLQSARVYAQRQLNLMVDLGQLIRGDGWYAVKGYRGEFQDHDRLLTKALAEILKLNYECQISREACWDSVGLRSDAVVLLKRGNDGLCFILEVVHNETPVYLLMKKHAWLAWSGANEALSKLFGYKIPHFSVITQEEICLIQ
jgi:hypothetical protein